jgi:hypothetical protein
MVCLRCPGGPTGQSSDGQSPAKISAKASFPRLSNILLRGQIFSKSFTAAICPRSTNRIRPLRTINAEQRERDEKEQLQAEQREQKGRLEKVRLETELREIEVKERLEAERLQKERQERLEAELRETKAKERLETERRQKEQQEQLEAECRERERAAAENRERLKAEQREKERLEAGRQEREPLEPTDLKAATPDVISITGYYPDWAAERREKERLKAEQRQSWKAEQFVGDRGSNTEAIRRQREEQERLEAEPQPPPPSPFALSTSSERSADSLTIRGFKLPEGSNHSFPGKRKLRPMAGIMTLVALVIGLTVGLIYFGSQRHPKPTTPEVAVQPLVFEKATKEQPWQNFSGSLSQREKKFPLRKSSKATKSKRINM